MFSQGQCPCRALGGGLTFGFAVLAAAAARESNTTLKLPFSPPVQGYSATSALTGFDQPVAIVSAPAETNRLFIVEKRGKVWAVTNLVNPGRVLFMDLSAQVDFSGEGGLLGLAFHPGFASNRWFFAYYTLNTTTGAGTGFHDRLARFEVSPADPNQSLPGSEVPLITQFDRASNHNGGDLRFGPDGYLYLTLGDEGSGGDEYHNSQRIDLNFFSGIIRIDVDRRPGSLPPNPHSAVNPEYAIPPDNPFVGSTGFNGQAVDPSSVRTEFWAVGLRNPWKVSFDPVADVLYCGDVGQGTREEVDIIVKGGNYGWAHREGTISYTGQPPPPGLSLIEPILDYGHTDAAPFVGTCITGGIVYRGSRFSQLYGDYVFGDYGSGYIWAFHHDGKSVTNWRRLTTAAGVVAFGPDPSNGDVLFAEIQSGLIRRLTYSTESTGDPLPATLADTGAFADLASLTPNTGVVPYEINVPFWSDHAIKRRWFSVPDTNLFLGFDPSGNWYFPTGTVWIKHFDLELTNGVPGSARRLETRFLVKNAEGVYGITYRWDAAQTNATLVPEGGLDETFLINDQGTVRTQVWHYPARSQCLTCHTPVAGYALGFNTAQLNREVTDGSQTANQILALNARGYFSSPVTNVAGLPAIAAATNSAASLELRARSFLSANCAQCHQPGGAALGHWDARFSTPLGAAGIIDGLLVNDEGNPANRVIKPGSIAESMILDRLSTLGADHMPPLATSELDQQGIALLSQWVANDSVSLSVTIDTASERMIRIAFSGVASRLYRLEASPELRGWQTLDSAQTDANGLGGFQVARDQDRRFFRLAWP